VRHRARGVHGPSPATWLCAAQAVSSDFGSLPRVAKSHFSTCSTASAATGWRAWLAVSADCSAPANVFSTLRCARQRLHALSLVARPKTAPRRQGLPLRAMSHAQVCASAPPHLYAPSASEDRATTAGLAPAIVCFTLRCVHLSAFTP